jgi:hypothetical protein
MSRDRGEAGHPDRNDALERVLNAKKRLPPYLKRTETTVLRRAASCHLCGRYRPF